MINLLFFISLVSFFGCSVLFLLKKFNLKLNCVEFISLCFPMGAVFLTFYSWILTFFGISYNFNIIYLPPIIISIIIFIISLLLFQKKDQTISFSLTIIKNKKKNNVGILIFLLLFIIILEYFAVILYSISTKVYQPDEYSQWAFQAKMIYLGKSLESFYPGGTGFETYPAFISTFVADFYFFSGEIIDSFIRIIGPLFLGSLLLFVSSKIFIVLKSYLKTLLLISIFITSGFVIFEISSGLYADIEYSFFYTVSVIYFLNYFKYNLNRSDLLFSAFFLGICSWIKTDGEYMILIHIFLLLIFTFKKLPLKKAMYNIFFYSIISLTIPLLWNIYIKINNFPASRWNFDPHVEYFSSMLKSSVNQAFDTTSWGGLWIIFIVFLFTNMLFGFNHKQKMILILIFSNLFFLYMSYLLMFGVEATTAASFSRYILRIAPLAILYVATVWRSIDTKIIGHKISDYN